MGISPQQLRAYVEYLRDIGVYDLYRHDEPKFVLSPEELAKFAGDKVPPAVASQTSHASPNSSVNTSGKFPILESMSPFAQSQARIQKVAPLQELNTFATAPEFETLMPKPPSFDQLAPLPATSVPAEHRPAALVTIREDIGDCTRCPLAYAGRRTIVFADGDPNAQLMFVGEGPGADEDASGIPFVGKAGQLLNNMIAAMGVTRESVYIANIVKCRPPQNRTPEPVEASTCAQFLVRQIDVVQPKVIVALGSTAATYLLGVKQSLASLRGKWHTARGAKVAVTYHPAFLLRDPRQKSEAWKDLQMVMRELGLQPPSKA